MMFMRQPEQRLLSEWHFSQPPWVNVTGSILTWMPKYVGCVTKMLTRNRPMGQCHDEMPPTRAEVDEATRRLLTGFSFIGMTEQWDLSICLFNVMFNQACRSYQFANNHPTTGGSMTIYDTAELNGFRDPYDNELFDFGVKLFEANLKRYNVSETSCQSCWHEAGLI